MPLKVDQSVLVKYPLTLEVAAGIDRVRSLESAPPPAKGAVVLTERVVGTAPTLAAVGVE